MKKSQLMEALRAKGFSPEILNAFEKVDREDFLPADLEEEAYQDTALPIGSGQTISQPYTIAIMLTELDLKPGQKVLEAGSGSGYVLALLSEIIGGKGKVFGIELVGDLAKKSREALKGYKNIEVYHQNAVKGLEKQAPFDRILMSAACREIPKKLLDQLKDKGILVAPKGPRFEQKITVIQRKRDDFIKKSEIPGFVFVPFVGG